MGVADQRGGDGVGVNVGAVSYGMDSVVLKRARVDGFYYSSVEMAPPFCIFEMK